MEWFNLTAHLPYSVGCRLAYAPSIVFSYAKGVITRDMYPAAEHWQINDHHHSLERFGGLLPCAESFSFWTFSIHAI